MKYKILEINQNEKWIKIEVDFQDGTPKYTKRMMADTSTEEGIHASVEQWLSDYLPQRVVEVKADLSKLKNKSFDVDVEKLPTRKEKDALAEAVK